MLPLCTYDRDMHCVTKEKSYTGAGWGLSRRLAEDSAFSSMPEVDSIPVG
jgi:hypothetical protein